MTNPSTNDPHGQANELDPTTSSNDAVFAEDDLHELESDSMEPGGDESPERIVDMLEQQVADLRDRELKAQAELENFRKRLLRDTEQQLKFASLPLVKDLLEVVDNLNRAMDAASNSPGAEGLIAGVKMVQSQLSQILGKYHCKPIPAVGHPFDPNFHQAIAQQPSSEHPAGTISLEASVGYVMHDRVVRPSMVIISTGSGN